MLEFSIVSISLAFLFAGAFTVGALLNKALQVSNITRSAAVLMVNSVTNPKANLNLALAQNQRILIREANGLGMASDSQFDPYVGSGNGAIFLTKIILVGDTECAKGVTPIPTGAPPWNTSNCPNYNSYVFAYYVPIGNNTRWASSFGTPPSADLQSDGSLSDIKIAMDTGDQIAAAKMPTSITLAQSQYVLVSEMYADVSTIAIFSVYKPPVIYFHTIT
jgi:hypothetical protein